jgi:hypothetical protein
MKRTAVAQSAVIPIERSSRLNSRKPVKKSWLKWVLLLIILLLLIMLFWTQNSFSKMGKKESENFENLFASIGWNESESSGALFEPSFSIALKVQSAFGDLDNLQDDFQVQQEACKSSETLCSAFKSVHSNSFVPGSRIPRLIHQSWSDANDRRVAFSIFNFREMNQEYTYLFWSDWDVELFFKLVFPELAVVLNLRPKILRYDLFRYLALLKFGGVWADVDVKPLRPIEEWILPFIPEAKKVDFLVGIETDFLAREEQDPGHKLKEFSWVHPLQFCQWTFASSPGNAVMREIAETVAANLLYYGTLNEKDAQEAMHSDTFIMKLTGPGVFSIVVHKHLRQISRKSWMTLSKLKNGTQVGKVGVLSITAFSPGLLWPDMYSGPVSDPRALVEHYHAGYWHGDAFEFRRSKKPTRVPGNLRES